MAELFPFSLQVLFGVGTSFDFTRHTLDDLDACALQRLNLVGIIGEQAHLGYTQRLEYLAGQGKVALVGLEAQPLVGFDGVESGILQLVGLQFGHQANAAALLLFVNQDAGAQVPNHGERHLQLLAAVAAQRMKNVAGEALRVNPNQRRSGVNISHHEGDGLLDAAVSIRAGFGAKAIDAELAPARREIRGSHLLNCVFGHTLIIAAVG